MHCPSRTDFRGQENPCEIQVDHFWSLTEWVTFVQNIDWLGFKIKQKILKTKNRPCRVTHWRYHSVGKHKGKKKRGPSELSYIEFQRKDSAKYITSLLDPIIRPRSIALFIYFVGWSHRKCYLNVIHFTLCLAI